MPNNYKQLLAIHCKKTDEVDFKKPIRNYIKKIYGNEQAEEVREDLDSLTALKRETCAIAGTNEGRDKLAKYYRALCNVETRIPVSKDSDNANISFVWYDAFKSTKKMVQTNVHYEKSGVLFNMAALNSLMALQVDRTTAAGLQETCKKFQESAGLYLFIRDKVAVKVDQPCTIDITLECLALLEKLMLAQAQECVYEKAFTDGKSSAILARLARGCADLYSETEHLFNHASVMSHFDNAWTSHVRAKQVLFETEALKHQADVHGENAIEEIGSQVSRLREAAAKLKGAIPQLKKDLDADSMARVTSALGTIQDQLSRAEKDNNNVYLKLVPAPQSLEAIQPAILVKALPPTGLEPVEGEVWFSVLVPEASMKAVSRYSDQVDSLVREQLDKLAGATDDARLKLKQTELPEILDSLKPDAHAALPEGVRRTVEEVQQAGGFLRLQELSNQIKALRSQTEQDIDACDRQLDAEAAEDSSLRAQYQDKWARPASHILTSHLKEKIAGYRSNLKVAGESDARVQEKCRVHEQQLVSLTPEHAVQLMPRLTTPMVSTSQHEPNTVVANLRNSCQQLSMLAEERARIEESLNNQKSKDNILPRLMGGATDHEALFTTELAKYNDLKAAVQGNVDRTQQLLGVISANYAAFQDVFGVEAWRSQCATKGQSITQNAEIFKSIQGDLQEGFRFYQSMQEAVTTLNQYVGDFVTSRRLNKDELLADLQTRLKVAKADEELARKLAADQEAARAALANTSITGHQPPPPQGHPPPPMAYPHPVQTPPGAHPTPPSYYGHPPPAHPPNPLNPHPPPGQPYPYHQQPGHPTAYPPQVQPGGVGLVTSMPPQYSGAYPTPPQGQQQGGAPQLDAYGYPVGSNPYLQQQQRK